VPPGSISRDEFVLLGQLAGILEIRPESGESRRTHLYPRQRYELWQSVRSFNRKWRSYLRGLDLTYIKQLRDGYNRYYVLEKECATRSARLARQHFRRLEALTPEQLLERFPLLPAPV